ncbi:MAG: hypothetical protein E6K24_03010 [Gammaproteobacteria bacterium]|nr:MAG: hypothetical protein E6K24_03010 [Gammaproteobacteria bacterium]
MALEAALCGEPKAAILERGWTVLGAAAHPDPSGAQPAGNSGVVAATCGALAGAHYTAGTIPASWRNSLIKKQLIESTADRLLAHALLEVGG